jgi:hypothetical protein
MWSIFQSQWSFYLRQFFSTKRPGVLPGCAMTVGRSNGWRLTGGVRRARPELAHSVGRAQADRGGR